MVIQDLIKIFDEVQTNSGTHHRNVQKLSKIYEKAPPREFSNGFMSLLKQTFKKTIDNDPHVQKVINFASKFLATVTRIEEEKNLNHFLLSSIIQETMKFTYFNWDGYRFHSCRFVELVLQGVGDGAQLDDEICNIIQEGMLLRLEDPKTTVRASAARALVRLQDPTLQDCPVIKAYLKLFHDPNPKLRREVVNLIAPNRQTLGPIKERILDRDPSVRSAAFRRCADLDPKLFKIVDRHTILMSGFEEQVASVKKIFNGYLLVKWLGCFNGNCMLFIRALILSAEEEQLHNLISLGKNILEAVQSHCSVSELLKPLPIGEDRLVPMESLSNDVTLYWRLFVRLCRDTEEMEQYLDEILPELTPFCQYIESIVETNSKKKMDEWEFMEYQFDLYNLLHIAKNYDLAEEVGRNNLRKLVKTILLKVECGQKNLQLLMQIAVMCTTDITGFVDEMCQFISELREPEEEIGFSEEQISDHKYQMATIRVKLNILEDEVEQAVTNRKFSEAHRLEGELEKYKNQLEALKNLTPLVKTKTAKDSDKTVCRCLDILNAMLALPELGQITPSLVTCKKEFIVPLITMANVEIHYRVLKTLALLSYLDEATAVEYWNIISIPFFAPHELVNYEKQALLVSISAVCDLLVLFSSKLLTQDDSANVATNTDKRRLYNSEMNENLMRQDANEMSLTDVFIILLDFLDGEDPEIRVMSIRALKALIIEKFSAPMSLWSRLIIKWHVPTTAKDDPKVFFVLNMLFKEYLESGKSDLMETVISTLSSIVDAPRTSPLADIDMDNVLHFYSSIANINERQGAPRVLALDLMMKLSANPNDRVAPYLLKLLHLLILPTDDHEFTNELIQQAESLLKNIKKRLKKGVQRFMEKLRGERPQVSATTIGNLTNDTRTTLSSQVESRLTKNSLLAPTSNDQSSCTVENREISNDLRPSINGASSSPESVALNRRSGLNSADNTPSNPSTDNKRSISLPLENATSNLLKRKKKSKKHRSTLLTVPEVDSDVTQTPILTRNERKRLSETSAPERNLRSSISRSVSSSDSNVPNHSKRRSKRLKVASLDFDNISSPIAESSRTTNLHSAEDRISDQKSVSVKRKKNRNPNNNRTALRTVPEGDNQGSDASSQNSFNGRQKVVLSETSDTDSTSQSGGSSLRRSRRRLKKMP